MVKQGTFLLSIRNGTVDLHVDKHMCPFIKYVCRESLVLFSVFILKREKIRTVVNNLILTLQCHRNHRQILVSLRSGSLNEVRRGDSHRMISVNDFTEKDN